MSNPLDAQDSTSFDPSQAGSTEDMESPHRESVASSSSVDPVTWARARAILARENGGPDGPWAIDWAGEPPERTVPLDELLCRVVRREDQVWLGSLSLESERMLLLPIELRERPGTVRILWAGGFGSPDWKAFDGTVERMVSLGYVRFEFEASRLRYVSSPLGSLVALSDRVRGVGGGVTLVELPERIRVLFEMLSILHFFDEIR